jgi:hypothetical protein
MSVVGDVFPRRWRLWSDYPRSSSVTAGQAGTVHHEWPCAGAAPGTLIDCLIRSAQTTSQHPRAPRRKRRSGACGRGQKPPGAVKSDFRFPAFAIAYTHCIGIVSPDATHKLFHFPSARRGRRLKVGGLYLLNPVPVGAT